MVTIVRKWWKEGTAYQVWPASYKDSNGDGIGDIPGIIGTLDYLRELGVDILWVSPAYASPQKDMGYDISDYEAIDPQYGTLQDAERLIQECHARGIKLLFDLVINHTSDQHAWFKESRSSKDNPKRDWYIWRPAKYDADGTRRPPNNWRSIFGGSAWEWDELTQEYWLHLFVPEQPDLNWENSETRQAIYKSAIKFWLDKGIDGFRIDTSNLYSKPTEFVDAPIINPEAEYQLDLAGFTDGPRMHEFLKELYATTLAHHDVMTVGELGGNLPEAQVLKYVSAQEQEMDMVFQFDAVRVGRDAIDHFIPAEYRLSDFKQGFAEATKLASDPSNDGWGTAFLENHDQARSISRFATDASPHRGRAAKLLALLLAASSGTLFLYQGQELGVKNAPPSWGPENYRDIEVINYLDLVRRRHPGDKAAFQRAMDGIQKFSRDNGRAPVPWTPEPPNAGFTDKAATPWMPLHPDFGDGWNAQDQLKDPESVHAFWKTALRWRKERPGVCVYGQLRIPAVGGERLFVLEKEDVGGLDGEGKSKKIVLILNFTPERQKIEVESGTTLGKVLLGNVENGFGDKEWLEPWEGRAYEVV